MSAAMLNSLSGRAAWSLQHAADSLRCMGSLHAPRGMSSMHAPRAAALKNLLEELHGLLPAGPTGPQISTSSDTLQRHGTDEGYFTGRAPDVVVWPSSNEQVSQVVAACARHLVPIVPFGVGTSVEGHVAALHGGVCVDMSRMDQVLEVNVDDQDCRVQAGCTRLALGRALRDTGLFFPVDPGADATLGGMASTRASGTNAVKYGTMRDAVLGLTAVMADGSIVRTGRRVRKSSAGYDLTSLLVGAEGTLGVITEVALRLHAVPECTSAAVCTFKSLQGAVECVQVLMSLSVPVARIELLDTAAVAACNRYAASHGSSVVLEEAPTLFFEFHGTKQGVEEVSQLVSSLASDHQGSNFKWAVAQEERDALWKARHSAYWAALALRPGCRGFPTDVCVPISRLAESIMGAQDAVKEAGLLAPMVGHVGDGNFHMMLVIDPNSATEVAAAKRVAEGIVERAIAVGGTCTGEHGVGYGKLKHLEAEHGPGPLHMMHAIKRALDPHNLMNPGKLGSDPSMMFHGGRH